MTEIEIIKGDITKLNVDAIVNAANESLLGGGGVDGAIHRAAGPELLEECRTLNGCETGQSKITKGYNLPAKYVIHTVGPVWRDGYNNERTLLESCYNTILQLVEEYNIKTIAIPAISCGVYHFPIKEACEIATNIIRYFVDKNKCLDKVIFVDINDKVVQVYNEMIDINKRCRELPIIFPHDYEWGGGTANCKEDEIPQLPYIKFAENDIAWLQAFYKLNLIDYYYMQHTKDYDLVHKDINIMTREEILSLLTYYIRQDRFCEGLLAEKIKSGNITKLVERLHEITKE